MKYWLHRISHEAETSWPLLEKGILTIGFSDLSDSEFLSKAKAAQQVADLDSAVKKAYGRLLRSRHSLWRFLKEMQIGDLVLVPGSRTFSVYVIKGKPKLIADIDSNLVARLRTWNNAKVRIEEGRLVTDDEIIDLGFYREVEVYQTEGKEARDIDRSGYADAPLTARMKLRNTNANISNLKRNLGKTLEAYKNNQPLNFRSDAMKGLAPELWMMIHHRLSPNKFEKLLESYFKRIGANEVTIPPRNQRGKEGDADIIACFDRIRVTIYIQAKFHKPNTPTDESAVEQILVYKDWKDREEGQSGEHRLCWVVSTCNEFTEECKQRAEANGVVLVNGIDFAEMLLDAGIEGFEI